MATASEVINLALKDAGVIAEGETPSDDIEADAFTTLKNMLAVWQVQKLYVHAMVENSFSPNGALSYTVGTGGTANFDRPEKIDQLFYRLSNIDYPIRLLGTFQEYEGIAQKTLAGQPEVAYYNPTVTTGTLYLYPQPSTGSVRVVSAARFPTLSTTASSLTFPSEYLMPIRFSLAEILSATFNTPISARIEKMAASSRSVMARNNVRIPTLSAGLCGHTGNIFSG